MVLTGVGVDDAQIFVGVTRMDTIRNEYIGGTAQVEGYGDKIEMV